MPIILVVPSPFVASDPPRFKYNNYINLGNICQNMKLSVLVVCTMLLCFGDANPKPPKGAEHDTDVVDYHTVLAQLRELRKELNVEKKSRSKLEDEIAALREQLKQKTTVLDEKLQLKDLDIANLKDTISQYNQSGQIAFNVANHDGFGPVTVDINIPFPEVLVNSGNNWMPAIHAFQAPATGTYMVFASIACEVGKTASAAIVHTDPEVEGVRVASLTCSEGNGDGNMAVVELDTGDYVSVQLLPDGDGEVSSAANYMYITFSGFLLFLPPK